jgi:quercetin dioxygenase-like cupin family protein
VPKRIVTGQREDGTSYFARVDELEQDFRGIGSHRVWAVDRLSELKLPYLTQAALLDPRPSPGETAAALRDSSPHPQTHDGLRIHLNQISTRTEPFLHWHDTYDLMWLLAGQLFIALDEGREVELAPGDVVVQHGANHSWRTGPDGALLAVFIFGAERTAAAPPAADKLDTAARKPRAVARSAAPLQLRAAPLAEMLARNPKRVVTGQRQEGTSVFARVEDAEPDFRSDGANGVVVHRMWANDSFVDRRELPFLGDAAPLATRPTGAETPEALRTSSRHAGPGGLRVSLIKFLPNEGGREYGLHWRNTVDVEWLFAGQMTIGLDDGSELPLQAGDVILQHGTNHSWRTGPDGAVVGLVMFGVERVGVAPPAETRAPAL